MISYYVKILKMPQLLLLPSVGSGGFIIVGGALVLHLFHRNMPKSRRIVLLHNQLYHKWLRFLRHYEDIHLQHELR